jgi:acetolactate synthase-like protein
MDGQAQRPLHGDRKEKLEVVVKVGIRMNAFEQEPASQQHHRAIEEEGDLLYLGHPLQGVTGLGVTGESALDRLTDRGLDLGSGVRLRITAHVAPGVQWSILDQQDAGRVFRGRISARQHRVPGPSGRRRLRRRYAAGTAVRGSKRDAARSWPDAMVRGRHSSSACIPRRDAGPVRGPTRVGSTLQRKARPVHGGDRVAAVLRAQGVEFLFTLCGGHISPILTGCRAAGIRVIDTRHEVTAVFAADAVARLTGIPGVAAVTAGPGVTNTVTAVMNARMAQSPLVLLGGAAPTALQGRGALQDIDQLALLRPIMKSAVSVRRVKHLGPALHEAFRTAQEGVPGPVFVEIPADLLYAEPLVRQWYGEAVAGRSLAQRAVGAYLGWRVHRLFAGSSHSVETHRVSVEPPEPDGRKLRRSSALLDAAERPLLLIGSQATQHAPLERVAGAVERLGIPVYLSGMARGLLGPRHPLQLRHRRREALREADLVILAGVPSDFRLEYGNQIRRSTPLIAVNRSSEDLARNRKPRIGDSADPGLWLRRLADRVSPRPSWAAWRASLHARDTAREAEIETGAGAEVHPINPLRLCREVEALRAPGSILVGDGGDFVATASYILHPSGPLTWLDPGPFGTLGVGAGFAIAAKLCRPDTEVWILYGDGAAGYSLVEMDTFVRHRLPVIALLANDAGWTQIAREQVEILGDDVGTRLARTDYHTVAEGFGARGLLLDTPAAIRTVLEQARRVAASGTPVLVNAHLGRSSFRKGSISM